MSTAAFAAGLVAWSLAEYLVHRFVLHRRSSIFWPEHALHHRSPLAEVGVPLPAAALVAMLSMLIAWSVGCLGFAVGGVVGYVVYVSVHEAIHRLNRPRWLVRLHDIHHNGYHANFGVTTPLWDIVFGTYRGEQREPVVCTHGGQYQAYNCACWVCAQAR